ncbi:MAG: hypothetical protein M3356_01165 [Actinomycetota bacterium]|nr:hypothetical protein [Actinomycetota bacterium]
MGVELFGILFLLALGAGAFLFFTGALGAGKTKPEDEGRQKPKHAYVEDDSNARIVGDVETADQVRARAQQDPDTDVRT